VQSRDKSPSPARVDAADHAPSVGMNVFDCVLTVGRYVTLRMKPTGAHRFDSSRLDHRHYERQRTARHDDPPERLKIDAVHCLIEAKVITAPTTMRMMPKRANIAIPRSCSRAVGRRARGKRRTRIVRPLTGNICTVKGRGRRIDEEQRSDDPRGRTPAGVESIRRRCCERRAPCRDPLGCMGTGGRSPCGDPRRYLRPKPSRIPPPRDPRLVLRRQGPLPHRRYR
jgi:hypothetical protein